MEKFKFRDAIEGERLDQYVTCMVAELEDWLSSDAFKAMIREEIEASIKQSGFTTSIAHPFTGTAQPVDPCTKCGGDPCVCADMYIQAPEGIDVTADYAEPFDASKFKDTTTEVQGGA